MVSAGLEFEDHGFRADAIHEQPVPKLHSHSELELNWIERGWVEYTTMQGPRLLEAGHLVCFWGAFPHQIVQMSEDLVGYWITVPHQQWLSWELPSAYRQEILSGAFRHLDGVSSERLQSWKDEVMTPELDPSIRRAMLLEMEACVLRSASPWPVMKTPERDRGSAAQKHASNLVNIITARYQEDLSVSAIASETGITPEYATSVFKDSMGISLKAYLTHLRVAHAQSLLLTTSKSITEIGYASGFNTMSRFYAAFQAGCGMTPKAYRKSHRVD